MQGVKGTSPHGVQRYKLGCRCLTCRREESLRVRAAYESACPTCGGPCWGRYAPGRRCKECVRREKKHRTIQPEGLAYQWGCP